MSTVPLGGRSERAAGLLFLAVIDPKTDNHRIVSVGDCLLLDLPVDGFQPRVLVLKLVENKQDLLGVLIGLSFQIERNERVVSNGSHRGKVNDTLSLVETDDDRRGLGTSAADYRQC